MYEETQQVKLTHIQYESSLTQQNKYFRAAVLDSHVRLVLCSLF